MKKIFTFIIVLLSVATTAFAQMGSITVEPLQELPAIENRGKGNLSSPVEIMGSIAQNRARYLFTLQKVRDPEDTMHQIGLYLQKSDRVITRTRYDFELGLSEGPVFTSVVTYPIANGSLLSSEGEESFLITIRNLKPGTEYQYFIREKESNTTSNVLNFITKSSTEQPGVVVVTESGPQLPMDGVGASGPYLPGEQPFGMYPESLAGVLDVRFPPNVQTITENSITIVAEVTARIPGPVPVRLEMQYGALPEQLTETEFLFDGGLARDVAQTFSFTKSGLQPGQRMYFRLKDTVRNLSSSLVAVDTKGGTGSNPLPNGVQQIRDTATAVSGTTNYASGLTVNNPYEETGLVPCWTKASGDRPCTFDDFLTLVANVIDYLLILLVPATAVVCVFAGVNFIISRGDPTKLAQAKELLIKVVIAAAVVMLSWVIIATVYKALGADKAYILLDIFS